MTSASPAMLHKQWRAACGQIRCILINHCSSYTTGSVLSADVAAGRSKMTSPATAALAVVAALLVLGSSTAEAKLSNVVTDWVNATQLHVATDGIPNQLAAR